MNLLHEYIRELLTEAAKGPQDLPDGIWVRIKEDDWGVEVAYVNKLGNELGPRQIINGIVMVENIPGDDDSLGRCGGAWMIGSSQAATGWGPMLYDVAMEYATMKGGGLMADRGSVSGDARKVWNYYMANRGDVTGIQMDDRQNTLTPEEEDNCSQKVAIKDEQGNRTDTSWTMSPLSKRWIKPPTTIEALRAAGKLVWHEAGDHLPIRDLDAEGPIIHLEQLVREFMGQSIGAVDGGDPRPTPPQDEFVNGQDVLAGYILIRDAHDNIPIAYAPITQTDGPDRPFLVRTTDTKWIIPFGIVRALYPQVEDAFNWVDSKEDWRDLGVGSRGTVGNFSWEWLENEPIT